MTAPPLGVCFEAEIDETAYRDGITDGDTLKLRRPESKLNFSVRLRDCWAPETTIRGNARKYPVQKQQQIKQAGLEARNALADLIDRNPNNVRVAIGFDIIRGSIFDLLTMSRVLGYVFVGNINVSEYLVAQGLAFTTKKDLQEAGLC